MRQIAFGNSGVATSQFAFRMQRFFYTPLVRWTLGVVLPAMLAAGAIVLVHSESGRFASAAQYFKDRPRFALTGVVVEADSSDLEALISEEVVGLFPTSPFSIDLNAIREQIISAIPAVQSVDLTLNGDGLVHIAVDGRAPKIVWRTKDGLVFLDEEGNFVRHASSRSEKPDLKLVVGEGADLAVPEALRLFKVAHPISEMIRGLRRVGMRRWDVVLDTGQRIMLPESEPEKALEKTLRFHKSHFLLNRRLFSIDLRDTRRIVVRAYPGDLIQLQTPQVRHNG